MGWCSPGHPKPIYEPTGGRLMASLLLRDAIILTQDPQRTRLRGDVLIDGSRIAAVGPDLPGGADRVIDLGGDLVLPGLINLHTHVAMTLMRGLTDDLELEPFLERTFALDARMDAERLEAGAALGCLEMLAAGTTSFHDLYYGQDSIAKAVESSGIRGFLSWVTLSPEMTTQSGHPVDNARAFIDSHQGLERIHPNVGFQGVYVADEDTVERTHELAAEKAVPIHLHLAESRREVADHRDKTGKRPAEWLRDLGFFAGPVVVAHGVWLTPDEMPALQGSAVAHCPVSNMKLAGGGFLPYTELRAAGVTVGLGTDGAGTNNALDMFREMRAAALWQKANRWSASVLPAQEALDLATIAGARALGRDDLGSLEVGKTADLVVVSRRSPAMALTNQETAVQDLVYAASGADVRMTIVHGAVVYEDGGWPGQDLGTVVERAATARRGLLEG